ncbi:MAG: glycosyltransferase [Candidatus Hydrogenedentota bacterium]|nr:MAG: glycosyltransferase [Candidatus Hydrogenedentota bacterium]
MTRKKESHPKPRLLFASFDLFPSVKGASQHIAADLEVLERLFDVTLFSLRNRPGIEVTYRGTVRHIRVGLQVPNYLERALAFRGALRQFLSEESFETAYFRSPWEGAVLVEHIPRTYFEVNALPSIELPYHFPDLNRNERLIEKIRREEQEVLERSERIICVSSVTERFLRRRGVRKEIAVVPNGFDTELFFHQKEKFEKKTLIYTGTLSPWQGVDFLLTSLRNPLRTRSDCQLILAVSGNKRFVRAYEVLARRLKLREHIRFEKNLEPYQAAALVRKSHIGLACLRRGRRNEEQGCSPIKILEYLGAGLPVAAPDLPVVREIVPEGTELYRPERKRSFLALVERLLEEPAESRKRRIRAEYAAKHFSKKRYAARLEHVLLCDR